jgi:hypothetical protein
MNPIRLRSMEQFEAVVASDAGLVISDSAGPPVYHAHPRDCPHVQPVHFATKVLENQERNGSYFTVPSPARAREEWPTVRPCRSDACLSATAAAGEPTLEWALREGTGAGQVRARRREPLGVEAVLTPHWEAAQRIALGHSDDRLVLRAWPGELKSQARAFYGDDRPLRLLALVETPGWSAVPLPHLAYNGSRPQDRFYFRCPLPLDRYLSFWQQPDSLLRVGAHPLELIEPDLWPWLCENGVADPDDPGGTAELTRFIERLARRRAEGHLRPGVEVTRTWDRSPENDPAALLREVREAVEQVAGALRENLPRG